MPNLTPVEALQREINGVKASLRDHEVGAVRFPNIHAWHIRHYKVCMAALELAKSVAENESITPTVVIIQLQKLLKVL